MRKRADRRRSSTPSTTRKQVNSPKFVNNIRLGFGDYKLLEFLRDIGKHFSVNEMVHQDSVKKRFEKEGTGISYTEFTYMLLQAC